MRAVLRGSAARGSSCLAGPPPRHGARRSDPRGAPRAGEALLMSRVVEPVREVRDFVRAALLQRVPRNTRSEVAGPRRRVVAGVTLVVGAVLLGVGLHLPAGDPRFYLTTLVLAAVWTLGAVASGPLHAGHARTRAGGIGRPVVQPLALAVLLVALFLAGGVVVARVPALAGPLDALLDHARVGSLPVVAVVTLVNGVGEELYFRGALFSAFGPSRAVAATTAVYTATTLATGIPLLVLAAAILGVVCGMQRRVTGGVVGPIIVHIVWSAAMLFLLPPVLDLVR